MPTAWEIKPATVLVIDREQSFCARLEECLLAFSYEVCVVRGEPPALEKALLQPWNAIIVGEMPADSGALEILRRIRCVSQQVPVLLASARPTEGDMIAGLEAGADAYLAKSSSARQFVARLRAISRRAPLPVQDEAPVQEEHRKIVIGDLCIVPATRGVTLRGRQVSLTHSQFEILLSLVKAAGRVKTREGLWAEIREREYGPFDRCLDVQVCTLRRKLGEHPKNPRFIHTVRSVGYMFTHPAAA